MRSDLALDLVTGGFHILPLQYYVNHAVRHGTKRATVQPGSVTFLQRFGGSINLKAFVADYTQ